MAKVKVPVFGTVGKSVAIDTGLESRIAAIERALASAGSATGTRHSNLSGLQVGDDHPQYAMWQAAESIVGQWNFATEPDIEGVSLTEFIQDTVALDLIDDTASVDWTYTDVTGALVANVVPEWVEDLVGAMLTDTASIDLVYNDGTGQITANIIDAYVKGITVSRYVRGASWGNASGIDAGSAMTFYVRVPVSGTIAKATLLTAGGTGSCVVDVRSGAYAAFPTVSSITAAAKPTITSGIKFESTSLTGWTTAVTAGSILAFVLESSSTFTQISIELEIQV